MEFKIFKKAMQANFSKITKGVDRLYEVAIDKDELWNLYLDSFPLGTNDVFRERREHDCSCCKHFIREVGNIVVIKNNKIHTIWDFNAGSDKYQAVIDALDACIKSKPISDIYVTKVKSCGTDHNKEVLKEGGTITWEHFYLEFPESLVNHSFISIPEIKNEAKASKSVFKRSLEEISMEAIDTVLELINFNTLYRGEEWKYAIKKFKQCKTEYDKLNDQEKDIYAWAKSAEVGDVIGRIRNHSIGVLLTDITNNMELNAAVRRYELIVAPTNYRRPKAIFTKKMLEDAKATIESLGCMSALSRRYATLDDISINNILFSNKDAQSRMKKTEDVFDQMMAEVKTKPKKFDKVEEMPIDKFINDVLPTAESVEVYVENKHEGNFCSLIAPMDKDSKHLFKWSNGYSWAYKGNLTDSDIKANVKSAGGNVNGVLRFSIQWNDSNGYDGNDEDAHCVTPTAKEIFFGNKYDCSSGGTLDVDIITPLVDTPAVENITWNSINKMPKGEYRFFVHCYSSRGGKSGFRAEIEFNGQTYKFDYNKPLRQNETVDVALVTLHEDNTFTIKEKIKGSASTKSIWGLNTNSFVPATVIMYSPNYWDEQTGIGNKHYMFMLKDCISDEEPNGFYNEFLKPEFEKHKRVFEALGSKMSVEKVDDQLSGLGFSSTKRNELIVKVTGNTERIVKIKF